MRTLTYLIGITFATLWYGTKAIVAGLLGIPSRRGGPYEVWQRRWAKVVLWTSGVKVKTVGLEHVPRDRSVVFISNHQSFFDILAIVSVLPDGVRFVAKKIGRAHV